ncbi:sodium/glutamate symporter [Shigella flexneri]
MLIERYGFTNATEVAMACATFGLVLGGLIGGTVALSGEGTGPRERSSG